MVNYLRCIEGKGDMKDIHCIERNAALFVSLLQNLFHLSFVLDIVTIVRKIIQIKEDAKSNVGQIISFIFNKKKVLPKQKQNSGLKCSIKT